MSPNSNDDLNNLVGKMGKGQNVPPKMTPPPVVGVGSTMNFGQNTGANHGLRNLFCCVGGIILVTTVLPFVLMGWIFSNTGTVTQFAMNMASNMSTQMTDMMPESQNSITVDGDTTKFDPIAGLDQAALFAGDSAKLISLEAKYVKPDGTMDLTASYHARTDYKFVRELSEPPEDAPPIGAGGSLSDKWYEPVSISVHDPGQVMHVTSMGGNFSYEGNFVNKGMERDFDKPVSKLNDPILDLPTCSFANLWTIAIENGAPKNAVATITYDEKGYEFRITDAQIYLYFDNACKLENEKSRLGIAKPAEIVAPVDPMEIDPSKAPRGSTPSES